jgi:hypothetical protein
MDHGDQIGGIHGAFATGGPPYLTIFQYLIPCLMTSAGYLESMATGRIEKRTFGQTSRQSPKEVHSIIFKDFQELSFIFF